MANSVSGSQDVAGASSAAASSTTPPFNPLLNQEINISNYMNYAQNFSYANSGLQSSIGLTPLTVNGQVVQTYDTKNGVQAEAFITTGSGAQHIVVGYAGTGVDGPFATGTSSLYSSPTSTTGQSGDLFTGAQFHDDVAILAGQTPTAAAASATAFANEVVSDAAQLGVSKSAIYLTGDNLGGTLAEYAASKTGLAGTTFGAAGISTNGSAKASNFKDIVANGDLVGNYAADGQNPLGPLVLSPDIKHYGTEKIIGPAYKQDQLRALSSRSYADAIKHGNENSNTSILQLAGLAEESTSLQNYAAYLKTRVSLPNYGSYANPTTSPSGTSAQASAPTASSGQASVPTTNLTTATATPPSTQVIQQDINLCNYLYNEKSETFGKSQLKTLGLQPLVQKGRTVEVYDQKAGVFGEAFETTGTGSPQIVIAYEGTDPYALGNTNKFTGGQLLDDAALFAGKQAAGATAAGSFADRVLGIANKMGLNSSQVSLTGHSLGAAEAEYAAEKTGLGGVTFGTPGIVATSSQPSQLTNFVDDGDPVGNYATDGEDPLGNFVTSSNIAHYGAATLLDTAPEGSSTYSNAAETSLMQTATNFFTAGTSADPNPAYKDLVDAGKSLGEDGYYHHLTTYAQSLANDGYGDIYLVCYCTGTGIRTAVGDRAVETLQQGEFVVTASGETRPIKWIGHRSVDCRKTPRPSETWPVRIAAHALGENRPARDLLVSPGHAICIDVDGEVLVPAGALVNGRTIVREEVDQVTYWHVELESHDILLAENLPAESYLEMGNRGFFANAEVVDIAAGPDAPVVSHASFCRPYVDGGPLLDAIRARLDKKADALTKLGEARAA